MPDTIPTSDDPLLEGAQQPSRKGPLSNPAARIGLIVGGVVVLLAVVGIVVALVLVNLGKQALEQATTKTLNHALAATSTPDATPTVETVVQGEKRSMPVTNSDVFVSRDPFRPVLKPAPAVEATMATITPAETNVMVLEDIYTDGGVLKAVLKWSGVEYRVGPGDRIGESPWQVLSVTKTTATLLFGDVQVTLSVGEGVQKE